MKRTFFDGLFDKHNANGSGRNQMFDVIKALGIIAIVLGHCHPNMDVVRFVYGFHLAIFFFVSGLQFNDAKYSKEPFLLIQNRFKSMWPSYFCYMTFFSLTINLFCKVHILSVSTVNAMHEYLEKIISNFFFSGNEVLGGAMWFVPMMLSGIIIFSTIVYFSTVFINRYRTILIISLSLVAGIIGLISCARTFSYTIFTHVALLLIPILMLGYLISMKNIDLKKLLKWPVALVFMGIFVYFTVIKDCLVNLSVGQIVSVYLFYPITVSGVYVICFVAKLITKSKHLSNVFSFVGKHSFDIMALHFLIIKVIDVIYGTLINDSWKEYSFFPRAYPNIWPIYLLASVVIAPFVRIGASKLYSLIKAIADKCFSTKEV